MKKNIQVKYDAIRLDQCLQQELGISRTVIKKYIRAGYITVNTKKVKPSTQVLEGDCIEIDIVEEPEFVKKPSSFVNIEFLYEDEDILVLNKPVGVLVHSGDSTCEVSLVEHLSSQGMELSSLGMPERPGVVHRLDRMTEGVMVLAKSDDAFESLKAQFQERRITKRYYANIKGNLQSDFLVIDRPIGRHPTYRQKMCVHPDGKSAISEVSVIKRYNTKTLCDISLITGRTHQIRVHLSDLGYPIIDDPVYGVSSKGKGQQSQSYFLSFYHPKMNVKYTFTLPISERLL